MIEINGTPGNDNLLGTGEADVIFALTGDDIISGSGGGDSLFGFEGNDTINGNEGNDTLFGNQNLDLLIGESGDDWLFGGKDGDIIEDGEGEDQLFGNLGDDLLRGGAGNDQRFGGKDNDTVIGGTGNDQVFGDRGNDMLWGVDINAVNPGTGEIDILTGGSEQDIFFLGDESRLYYIGSGNNDFALITDFNVLEDQINVGNNQVTYTETTLNELGLGVAISSQSGDLVAFVQGATVSQVIESSNTVEPSQTDEAIPRQEEELQPTPNTAPIADNDNYNTSFESAIIVDASVGVLNGDSDGNGDPLIPILVNLPVNGSLNYFNADGSFSYTPNAGFSGVDSFIYVANDGELNSNVATVTIDVGDPSQPPTNIRPEVDNDNYSTDFQSPLTVDAVSGILNGDSDGDGDPITAILVNSPANGSLNLNPDGSFSYTPNGGFSGVDSFIYVANDGELNSNVATVTINVDVPPTVEPNTPPNADNDNYTTGFQSPLTVDASVGILNGDSDGDGDPISAILVNSPANGSVNLNPDGSFSYTPNAGFSGVDSFIYVANDGKDNSNVATVTIDVAEPPPPTPTPEPPTPTPPVADNDNYTTDFESPILVDAVSGVLNNDSDGDGDPISAILVNSPANGSLNLNPDGSFSYTPNGGFSGVDSFIYVANDGELNSNVATVTINVDVPPTVEPNTPPNADNDNYTTGFQSPLTVDASVGVLNNDSDGDGDPISAILVNSPANGSLNLNPDGSFSYTPNAGFSGVDSFIYVANDGELNSNVATVTINVDVPPTVEPNTPPNADNDDYTTGFESPILVDAVSGVLNGDSDGDGDPISARLVNPPANGSLNLNGDGSFSYTPNSGFSGVDSFIYVANDGTDNSDVATVTIGVEPPPPPPPPNTPPVADNDNYTTGFQSPITVDASVGVLNGDSDGDGDPITAILVNPPVNGSVNLNGDGSFSYTPNSGFSGVDSFIYVANDGKDNSDAAIVTINVEQTRHLNGYSHRGEDQTQVFRTFFVTNEGNNGQIILDQTLDDNRNDSNPDLGVFPEAIQNFIVYEVEEDGFGGSFSKVQTATTNGRIDFDGETELQDGGTLSFNEVGEPIFTGVDITTEITPVVDLRVRLIEQDDIITEFDLTDDQGNPIIKEEAFPEQIIIYEFIESGTDNILEELVVSRNLPNKPINFNLATNSLEYIIEQNLLPYGEDKLDFLISSLFPTNSENILIEEDANLLLEELYRVQEENLSVEFVALEKAEPFLLLETTYSQRENETTVLTTFLLSNDGSDGQIIDDQTLNENGSDSDTDLGFYPEAIQDFVSYNNESGIALATGSFVSTPRINFNRETELQDEGTLSFNEQGEPIFTGVDVETEITPVLDLRVRLIEQDDIITEFELTDEEGNPLVEIDESFGEIIAYEFLESGIETVREELFLFTNEFGEVFWFTDESLNQTDKVNLATNSLESIIEDNLLRFTLEKPDAIQVILGEVTPSEGRSNGEGFVNNE